MTQLTIRNFPPEIEREIRAIAQRNGWSLNKAAVFLMKQGAGLTEEPSTKGIGEGLDAFIGSWKKAESEAFDKHIEEAFESVDEALWQ
jgi:hypothetical protein